MSIIGKLFPEDDEKFAQLIANKIATRYPPKVEKNLQFVGGKKRLSGVLEVVLQDIRDYQSGARMGWIRKARFANTLKWQLIDKKYSPEFVAAIADGVVANLVIGGGETEQ